MPTAPKFIGALLFAALSWFVADLYKGTLPEGSQTAWVSEVSAIFGFLFGWRLMGRNAGRGMRTAIGYALTTGVVITVWSLGFWAAYRMIVRSARMFYDNPSDAVADFFSLFARYAEGLAAPEVAGSLIVGAVFCGWLTEEVSRRFA